MSEIQNAPLSRCEIEVLSRVGEGLSNKEAAAQLFVSKRTVEFHLANVYRKLGVGNRMRAIQEAFRRGILAEG